MTLLGKRTFRETWNGGDNSSLSGWALTIRTSVFMRERWGEIWHWWKRIRHRQRTSWYGVRGIVSQASEWQQNQNLAKAKKKNPLRTFRGGTTQPVLSFPTSVFPNSERMNFSCFKTWSLWQFVTAALGNKYTTHLPILWIQTLLNSYLLHGVHVPHRSPAKICWINIFGNDKYLIKTLKPMNIRWSYFFCKIIPQ